MDFKGFIPEKNTFNLEFNDLRAEFMGQLEDFKGLIHENRHFT